MFNQFFDEVLQSDSAFVIKDAFDVVDVEDSKGYDGKYLNYGHVEALRLRPLLAYKCEK